MFTCISMECMLVVAEKGRMKGRGMSDIKGKCWSQKKTWVMVIMELAVFYISKEPFLAKPDEHVASGSGQE